MSNTADINKINEFTRRPLTEDEVYTFDVILCDNKTDRDGERFSDNALKQMKELFIGKTGIFDHNPKGEKQTARIFDTEIVEEDNNYKYLKANCYMMRTNSNSDLILEIDGGIKKEVSVSCSCGKKICSICGKDAYKTICNHNPGRKYGNKICCFILDDVTDAYEWSFVAVPAQINAGVTKKFSEEYISSDDSDLKNNSQEILEKTLESIRKDVVRLCYLNYDETSRKAMIFASNQMSPSRLIEFKEELMKKHSGTGVSQFEQQKKELNDDYKF